MGMVSGDIFEDCGHELTLILNCGEFCASVFLVLSELTCLLWAMSEKCPFE